MKKVNFLGDRQLNFGHHRCVTLLYGIPLWSFYLSVYVHLLA
jgi:hypothetical protein